MTIPAEKPEKLDKYANRRARLRALVDELAGGNQAHFARKFDYSRAQIGHYLSSSYANGRTPGAAVCEELERRLGLSSGWFDQPAEGDFANADDALVWPFMRVDPKKVSRLTAVQQLHLEANLLIAAAQLGFDIELKG